MASTGESSLPLKLFALLLFFTTFCPSSNVVYGGKCNSFWENSYACEGNRRSLPTEVSEPRKRFREWKRNSEDPISLAREALFRTRVRNFGENQIRVSDDAATLSDDQISAIFHRKFALRQGHARELSKPSAMAKSVGKSVRDGSLKSSWSTKAVDGRRLWSDRATKLLDQPSMAGRGLSSTVDDDITLEQAVSKVQELIARRRLLDNWQQQMQQRLYGVNGRR